MEIQRKIVESKNPPSNREVWWFDTNSESIKNYKKGKWQEVSISLNSLNDNEESSIFNGHIKYETSDNHPMQIDTSAVRYYIDCGGDISLYFDKDAINKTYAITRFTNATKLYVSLPKECNKVILHGNASLEALALDGGIENLETYIGPSDNVGLQTLILPDNLKTLESLSSAKKLHTVRLGNLQNLSNFSPTMFPASYEIGLQAILGPNSIESKYLVYDSKLIYYANQYGRDMIMDEEYDCEIYLPAVKTINTNSIRYLPYRYDYDYSLYVGHILHIPDTVENIEYRAFAFAAPGIVRFSGKFSSDEGRFCVKDSELIMYAGCSLENTVVIPTGITSIANGAFQKVTSFSAVYIPESVSSMGNYAFGSCSNLTDIYIKAVIPPVIDERTFYEIIDSATIYVPVGSADSYKKATNWSMYADKITEYNF